jgi:D-glycero-D-manno-heptose 1,7-bisphosphate phosphatase
MGERQIMSKAVFLDRDGVINELILNPETHEYEPPHRIEDVRVFPYAARCLRELRSAGYDLFLVSNQPDYAKGKVSLEILKKIHEKIMSIFTSEKIAFRDVYYCYHHPDGVMKDYTCICECRKPKPYFLFQAEKDYSLDLARSWMIGDRDTDIVCGQAAGVRTVLIDEPKSCDKRGNSQPDFIAKNLSEATKLIVTHSNQTMEVKNDRIS